MRSELLNHGRVQAVKVVLKISRYVPLVSCEKAVRHRCGTSGVLVVLFMCFYINKRLL